MSKQVDFSGQVTVDEDGKALLSAVTTGTERSKLRIVNTDDTNGAIIKISGIDIFEAQPGCDIVLSGLSFRGAVTADRENSTTVSDISVTAW